MNLERRKTHNAGDAVNGSNCSVSHVRCCAPFRLFRVLAYLNYVRGLFF